MKWWKVSKSSIGIKKAIENNKKINTWSYFCMWTEEVENFNNKVISGTRELVGLDIRIHSLENKRSCRGREKVVFGVWIVPTVKDDEGMNIGKGLLIFLVYKWR